jgi:MHS family proline/betaine transporter-like MFS transporter
MTDIQRAILKKPTRSYHAVAVASIANALEWFDFVVYGYFASTIAKLFFPSTTQIASLLLAFATFGITFLVRPLGAVLLGSYADCHGRKAAFALAVALMMLGTAMIVLTPSYAVIGPLAPIVIVIARLIQGISAGGSFGSATALLAEQSANRRGFFASWQFASQGLTTMIAAGSGAILSAILTQTQIDEWGWRIPFAFGLLIGPVAYYIHMHVEETEDFRSLRDRRAPVRQAMSVGKSRLLVSLGLVVLCTVVTYTTLFMPTFAVRQLGLPQAASFAAVILFGALQVVLVPCFGSLSDRCGRTSIMIPAAGAILLLSYPAFAYLAAAPSLKSLLIFEGVMGVLAAAYMGPLASLMSEIFPAQIRTTGLAISYSACVAAFGGFAPFINAWLVNATGANTAPSLYLMLAALISLAALGSQTRGLLERWQSETKMFQAPAN